MVLRYEINRATGIVPIWEVDRVAKGELELSEKRPLRVTTTLGLEPVGGGAHSPYALELGVLTGGKVMHFCREHQRELMPGDVWLCAPWEPRRFELSEEPCSAVVATIFPPMLASSMFPELPAVDWLRPFMLPPHRRPSVPPEERGSMLALARDLTASQSVTEPRRWLVQRLLVYQILLLLPRPASCKPQVSLTDDYARVQPAIDLILSTKRYVKSIEAAQSCGMTVRSFSRTFQRVAGSSFHAFSARHRLQGAALQLLESADPVKAIAHTWGFFDASHFHQAFRAVYGCSPVVYRRTAFV